MSFFDLGQTLRTLRRRMNWRAYWIAAAVLVPLDYMCNRMAFGPWWALVVAVSSWLVGSLLGVMTVHRSLSPKSHTSRPM